MRRSASTTGDVMTIPLYVQPAALDQYRTQCHAVAILWNDYQTTGIGARRTAYARAYDEAADKRDAIAHAILAAALEDHDQAATAITPAHGATNAHA